MATDASSGCPLPGHDRQDMSFGGVAARTRSSKRRNTSSPDGSPRKAQAKRNTEEVPSNAGTRMGTTRMTRHQIAALRRKDRLPPKYHVNGKSYTSMFHARMDAKAACLRPRTPSPDRSTSPEYSPPYSQDEVPLRQSPSSHRKSPNLSGPVIPKSAPLVVTGAATLDPGSSDMAVSLSLTLRDPSSGASLPSHPPSMHLREFCQNVLQHQGGEGTASLTSLTVADDNEHDEELEFFENYKEMCRKERLLQLYVRGPQYGEDFEDQAQMYALRVTSAVLRKLKAEGKNNFGERSKIIRQKIVAFGQTWEESSEIAKLLFLFKG